MEFLDPRYKKRHNRLLFVGYALLSILIAFLASLFVLEANGFYLGSDGTIVQNSILQVDSHPGNARVFINGILEDSRTDARYVLPEGRHFVEIQRNGYEPWQKEFNLEGGKVFFAQYPFLYPEEPVETTIESYRVEATLSQTPDRRWLAVLPEPTSRIYDLYDLNEDVVQKEERLLPPELASTGASYSVLEWSTDNRHALVEVLAPSEEEGVDVDEDTASPEYWIVDMRGNDDPLPVDVDPNKEVLEIQLVDGDTEFVLVHYADMQLVRYEVEDGSSTVVGLRVQAFASHGENIVFYAVQDSSEQQVRIIISDDLEEYELVVLESDDPGDVRLDVARFDGDWLYVVGASGEERLRVYQNPLQAAQEDEEPRLASNLAVNGLSDISFSANTRFIFGVHDGGLVIYDAEDKRPYRFTQASDNQEFAWMDGHRVMTVHNNNLTITEFDGFNSKVLSEVRDIDSALFDQNYDFFYSLRPVDEQLDLVSTSLLSEGDL